MDRSYPLLPIANLILFVLVLLPLPWLSRRWNVGVWMYAIWVSIGCLMHGINTIVWKDNVRIVSPVWCDICVRFFLGIQVALPAASLTITRRINQIMKLNAPMRRENKGRNEYLFDLFLCLGLPLVAIGISHIVQGHRFDIVEELGCSPAIVNNVPSYFLVFGWPLAIGSISLLYCISVAGTFFRSRMDLESKLATDKSMTYSHFYRVYFLGLLDALITVPISVFQLWVNIVKDGPVQPWKGWADVHFNFSRISQTRSAEWSLSTWSIVTVRWNQWLSAFCAFVFLCFFGFTSDVRGNYIRMLKKSGQKLGMQSSKPRGEYLPRMAFSSFRAESSSEFTSDAGNFRLSSSNISSPDGL